MNNNNNAMTWQKQTRSFILPLVVTIIVPGLMYFLIPGAEPVSPLARAAGIILWLLSIMGFWSVELPFMFNKQSLYPGDVPTRLILVGFARVNRNPMMQFGIFPILLSLGLILTPWVWIWMVVFIVGMDWHIRKHEEPGLVKQFGDHYRSYMNAVPRWGVARHPYDKPIYTPKGGTA